MGQRVAIIGTGIMGGALLSGLLRGNVVQATEIIAVDVNQTQLAAIQSQYGVNVSTSVKEVLPTAELAVLAVKPWIVPEVLRTAGAAWPRNCLLVSIAAGVKIASLEALLPDGVPVVRAMPNTPALIGAGVTAVAAGSSAKTAHLDQARAVLSCLGSVVTLREESLDAVTGLSGSGPAYVYLFIEALIDAGVREGLPRDVSRQLALETVLGSARLVKESGKHPAELKDAVTTPGGTTIAGLAALEKGGLRGLIFDAVKEATLTSRLLGKGGEK